MLQSGILDFYFLDSYADLYESRWKVKTFLKVVWHIKR